MTVQIPPVLSYVWSIIYICSGVWYFEPRILRLWVSRVLVLPPVLFTNLTSAVANILVDRS